MTASFDIVSIGEAMAELSCEGDLRYATGYTRSFGGDTLNTAIAARRLGSDVAYVTRLANDPFGLALQETILKEGVHLDTPRHTKGGTGMYFVSVDAQGEREFFYYRKGSAASYLCPDDIDEKLIRQAKIVFASGISLAVSESSCQAVVKAFKIAREAGVMTAFDPNYREALWPSNERSVDAFNAILPLTDIFMPAFPEDTRHIISFTRPEQIIEHFMFKGVKLVVAKVGGDGCYIGYKREVQHVSAMHVKPVDTTGAGDAFNGGFLHGIANGEPLLQCAKLGVTTAGLKVLNRGSATAMPLREAVYSRVF